MAHGVFDRLARRACAALLALASATAFAQVDAARAPALRELLSQAAASMGAGRAAEALRLLERGEDEFIGDPDYDYALGRAALEAGHPDRATLAFGRVLAVDPAHAGAAIDLARAYLALGNREQAAATLRALIALGPPPALRVRLEALLAQARSAAAVPAFLRGHVSASVGRDTNVNFALSQSRVFVPVFGVEVDLASANRARADRYASLAAGVDWQRPLGDSGFALVAGADLVERRNAQATAFDLGVLAVRGGLGATIGRHFLRAQAVHARTAMDGSPLRRTDALQLDLRPPPERDLQWNAYLLGGRYRHPQEALRGFDADFATLGGVFALQLSPAWTAFAGASAGAEADQGGNAGGDRRIAGARVGAEVRLGGRWSLSATATRQATAYERVDGAFGVVRRDGRSDVEFAAQLQLDPRWQLRGALVASRQQSSIAIYVFERQDASLTLRWSFD